MIYNIHKLSLKLINRLLLKKPYAEYHCIKFIELGLPEIFKNKLRCQLSLQLFSVNQQQQ